MKTCSFCGTENADSLIECISCCTDLNFPAVDIIARERTPQVTLTERRVSNLPSAGFFKGIEPSDAALINLGDSISENFTIPDWKAVRQSIEKSFLKEEWPQAWRAAGIKWLEQLREDLGGAYNVHESWNILLLSAESAIDNETLLKIAEYALQELEVLLGSFLEKSLFGKRVLIVFNEEDDYYAYVSCYHEEGHHGRSSGMFIRKDYAHITLPFTNLASARTVITHELTHNCVMELKLPTWLNEGTCRKMERLNSRQRFALNQELASRHKRYWTPDTIQNFWAGTSFYGPGEENSLSYSLGEIIVEFLSNDWKPFLAFLQTADRRDAGQDATGKFLDKCLGETASSFLGPGDWRPNRKRIAELWKKPKAFQGNLTRATSCR